MENAILKKIIIENKELIQSLNVYSRNIEVNLESNFVFCGIRRCGKSYLQFIHIKALQKERPNTPFVYINFEDERFIEFSASEFDQIVDVSMELFNDKPVFFFDEIQNIKHWEKFARRLADNNYRVFVTGSNAQMLSKEIGSTLGGRFLIKKLFPLSFAEYLRFKEIDLNANFEFSKQRFEIIKQFNHFFENGGFPELLKFKNPGEYLSSLYMKVFYGDIISRYHIQNDQILKLLIKKLAESVNNETSLNRIKNLIVSTGQKVGNNTISEYINYLVNSFLLFPLENFASTFIERETKKKYYFIDQGILNLFITDQPTKLLENIVFLHLYKQYSNNLYYFKRNYEVDFYIPDQQHIFQVSYSMADSETQKRELQAIQKVNKELKAKKISIITYNDDDIMKVDDLEVEVISVWKWLLKT